MASGVFPRDGDTERWRGWSGWKSRVGGSRTSPWALVVWDSGTVEQGNSIRRRLESARGIARGLLSAGQFYPRIYSRLWDLWQLLPSFDAQCALSVGGPAPEFVPVHQLNIATTPTSNPPHRPQTSQTPGQRQASAKNASSFRG